MLALLQHPEQLARLKDDPSLIPTAVEEFLRWASPVYHFRRTATRDVELGGKQVKEGDRVVMWYASGNRDEEVFGNPYDFDITRADNDHVTFGKGSPHLCLGNLLARTEIRIMFEEVIPRLADIRLVGEVPRALELRQRHQEAAGRGHPRLTEPFSTRAPRGMPSAVVVPPFPTGTHEASMRRPVDGKRDRGGDGTAILRHFAILCHIAAQ